MIHVEDVHKSWRGRAVLTGVSFSAPPGTVTAFVGPNGAGKSTTMKIIAGLVPPTSGRATIDGIPFAQVSRPASTLGVFLSAESIPLTATAAGYLAYVCQSQGFERSRIADALRIVGLESAARKRVSTLSLGMRQRLGLAAATIGTPTALLLDEPANGLDPDGLTWFRSYVLSVARRGGTVLISSHQMAELSMIADRVVMIDHGRIVADGSIADFLAESERPPVYIECAEPDRDRLQDVIRAHGWGCDAEGRGFLVHRAAPAAVSRAVVQSGIDLLHLSERTATLEKRYLDRLEPTDAEADR